MASNDRVDRVLMGTGPSTRKVSTARLPTFLVGLRRSHRWHGSRCVSVAQEIPIGTEPRLMTLFGHPNQVSTIQAVIQEASGKLWKLIIGINEQAGWQGVHCAYHKPSRFSCRPFSRH